jgi:hypothetical protein
MTVSSPTEPEALANGGRTVVVQAHHRALFAWSQYRARLPLAPRLITLDHHTDTSRPFRTLLRESHAETDHDRLRAGWLGEIDFRQPSTVVSAIDRLSNDEHIVTAIETDIISDAFVVAHNARDIMCRTVSKALKSYDVSREDCDKVIESRFLDELLASFSQALSTAGASALLDGSYILDIDLDYFNTFASVAPKDASALRALAKGAGLITIATEPEHVKVCALDEDLSSDFLLTRLLALLT